jgi:hypothetical protein
MFFGVRAEFRCYAAIGSLSERSGHAGMLSLDNDENDPERLSSALFFCAAIFLFDHLVRNGEHAGRDVETATSATGLMVGCKARLRPRRTSRARLFCVECGARAIAEPISCR